MSNSIELYKDLPKDTATFYIDIKGRLTGTHYRGEFKCKIPSVKTHLEIDKHRAFLCGDMVEYLQPSTIMTYKMLAYLRFTIVKAPEFWEQSDLGSELKDFEVIENVYDKVLELEGKWLDEAYPDRKKEANVEEGTKTD